MKQLNIFIIFMLLLGLGATAAAQGTVTPSDLQGWIPGVRDNGTYEFVSGPDTPPAGIGSVLFTLPERNDKAWFVTTDYSGTLIKDLTALNYFTFRVSGGNLFASSNPVIQTVEGVTFHYEPYYPAAHTIEFGKWQFWDALDNTGPNGGWNHHATPPGTPCDWNRLTCTWAEFAAAYGDYTITNIFINNGSWWHPDFVGAIDALTIGVNGTTTTYDFEPAGVAAGAAPLGSADQANWGDVYHNARPHTILSHVDTRGVTLPPNGEIFWRDTPAENAYLIPPLPAGTSFAYTPSETAFFDVFGMQTGGGAFGSFAGPIDVCFVPAPGVAHQAVAAFSGFPAAWHILSTAARGGLLCGAATELGEFTLVTGASVPLPAHGAADEQDPVVSAAVAPNQTTIACSVTTTHTVRLRAEPSETSQILTRIPYDRTLMATAESGGWTNVVWLDGSGWVSNGYLTGCE